MRLLKTEAIVLKNILLGETDKIAILFTKNYGKVQAVAKGARRSKSRFIGAVRTFNVGNYVLFEGQNYYYIDQWELLDAHIAFEKDLMKLSYAAYFVDMVNKVLHYDEKNSNLYSLLKNTLYCLDKFDINPEILSESYRLKFLTAIGYMPELDICSSCGENGNLKFFSPASGGLVCDGCRKRYNDVVKIHDDTIKALKYLLMTNLTNLKNLKLPGVIISEMDKIITEYIKVHMEMEFQTRTFLENLKKM